MSNKVNRCSPAMCRILKLRSLLDNLKSIQDFASLLEVHFVDIKLLLNFIACKISEDDFMQTPTLIKSNWQLLGASKGEKLQLHYILLLYSTYFK